MPANYLEQLVSEWYEYQGYFVRRNVLVGKRAKGGHECELDVVAFHPARKHLVQVEPSMDADSWAVRQKRYEKKFRAGKKYASGLFVGLGAPLVPDQIALFGYGSGRTQKTVGDGTVMTIRDFLRPILAELGTRAIGRRAVPEHMVILRTIQILRECRDDLRVLWERKRGRG